MPNRFVQKNGTTVAMLTRVPVNRGSLLKSIDHLLKTIETSENAVMIPTLLKDKLRVDACELLFVAKILKASILGHSDLVEFYMNHIGHTTSALQQPSEPPSPSIRLQQSPMGSPLLTHAITNHQREQQQQQQQALAAASAGAAAAAAYNGNMNNNNNNNSNAYGRPTSGGSQGASSNSSMSTCSSSSINSSQASTTTGSVRTAAAAAASSSISNGSGSWMSAREQSLTANTSGNSLSSSASFNSNGDTPAPTSNSNSSSISAATHHLQAQPLDPVTPTNLAPPGLNPPIPEEPAMDAQEALLATASKPLMARLAQPPSLLQLTTTNNHINSMSDIFQAQPQLSPSLEQLTSQLAAMQQQQQQHHSHTTQNNGLATSNGTFEGLSISTAAHQLDQLAAGSAASTPTATAQQQTANGQAGPGSATAGTPPTTRHELRSSRSAGCLFRANSGATSPRTPNQTTPTTPAYPQAETLAGASGSNGLVGEPSSLVKLLLQVEQLKLSIAHCTKLLDSVVELYKKSIDNIAGTL